MKILVTAGGTGGHIYPALAIIDKFKELDKNTEVIYVGTTNRMESQIVPNHNIKYIPIEIYGLSKTKIIQDIKNIFLIKKAYKEMIKLLSDFKPDYVLGIGGYVTYPVIKAAHHLGIPIFIHEQNAVPGKVNRLTAKYAELIGVSFKESIKYFKNKNVIYTGNPTGIKALSQEPISLESLNLDANKKLIVFVMGSLGSMSINNIMNSYLNSVKDKSYQVLYITGKNYYDELSKKNYPKNVKLLPYLDNLPGLLKNTYLLVTRAGASTIAEINALNVVSLYIPSPYVANNHQYYNAMSQKETNCGEILEEKDFSLEKLNNIIDELIANKSKYQTIKDNLKKQETIDSCQIIYDEIVGSVKNDRQMRNKR